MNTIGKIKVGGTTYDVAYPVGSIYLSVNDTSPAELFGGTWEQIKDAFLLGAGGTYEAGSTGGEAQHTLTVEEMPSHKHSWKGKAAGSLAQSGPGYRFAVEGIDEWNTQILLTGGGQPHNNMPPYLAVYMWKRIA